MLENCECDNQRTKIEKLKKKYKAQEVALHEIGYEKKALTDFLAWLNMEARAEKEVATLTKILNYLELKKKICKLRRALRIKTIRRLICLRKVDISIIEVQTEIRSLEIQMNELKLQIQQQPNLDRILLKCSTNIQKTFGVSKEIEWDVYMVVVVVCIFVLTIFFSVYLIGYSFYYAFLT